MCNEKKNQDLVVDLNLRLLLESAIQVFEKEKILKRVTGTFDGWVKKNTPITSHHARRLRSLAKQLKPFPKLATPGMSTTEVYNKLGDILKVLEVPEYQDFWSHTI